jgi:phytanoyl-CoA hydroxylase
LDDEVIPRDMQYFRKPPLVGQATPPHQDGYYFMLEPPSAVTMWLALDTVDSENGCLHYVKASHTRGMRPHGRTETLGFSQGIIDFPRAEDTAGDMTMCANPGDLIAHHALTIHRADGNKSKERDRRALGFVYFARGAKEDVAGRKAYKEQMTRTWKEAGKL